MHALGVHSLEHRVASRYVAAALLPDKFVKAKRAAFKALLATPAEKPRDWAWQIQDRLVPFVKKLHEDLLDIVELPVAEQYLKGKFDRLLDYLEKLCGSHRQFGQPHAGDIETDVFEYLNWYLHLDILEAAEEKVKTLGDLLKTEYMVDQRALDNLASRFYKGLSDEDQAGLMTSRRYAILVPSGIGRKALKCCKTVKLDLKPLEWFDTLIAGLVSRFSEQAIQDTGELREFDISGLKLVIQDPFMEPGVAVKYVDLLKKSHAALKAKKLDKVWYGFVQVLPEGSGGVNHNTGGGTGGLYYIDQNEIAVMVKPDASLPSLLVHELGHRYWYKFMTSEQRQRFEALVKTHRVMRPYDLPSAPLLRDLDFDATQKALKDLLGDVNDAVRKGKPFTGMGPALDLRRKLFDVLHSHPEEAGSVPERKLFQEAGRRLQEGFLDFDPSDPESVKEILTDCGRLRSTLSAFIKAAIAASRDTMKDKGRDWAESYDNNPAPVLPVSSYGASNPSEAFAEAFASYVWEADMTRDQLESFRSVIDPRGRYASKKR